MKQYLFNILVGLAAWIIYASLNNNIILAIAAFLLSFVIGLWRALMMAVTWTAYFLSLPLTISITLELSNIYVALVTLIWGLLLYWLFYLFVLRRYAWTTVSKKDGVGSTLATPRRLTRTSTRVQEPVVRPLSKEEIWEKAVEECNLFGFLEDPALKLLLKDVREVDIKSGETIVTSGEFMLLLQGEVELSLMKPLSKGNTKKCQLAVMKAKDPCGSLFDVLSSLCHASLRPLTIIQAVALSDVKVLVIPRTSFIELREQYPKAAAHIVQVVLRRFQKVTHSLLNRFFDVSMHESCILPAKSTSSKDKSHINTQGLADEMSSWSRTDREAWQKMAFSYLMKAAKLGKDIDDDLEKYRPFWDTITLSLTEKHTNLCEKDGKCNSLIVLLDGEICLEEKGQEGEDSIKYNITQSGALINAASSFLGNRALSTTVAEKDSLVAHIDRRILEVLIDREPRLLLNLAKPILERIPPIFNCIERSLEWINMRPGQILCQRGQAATHLYIILHGRIRGYCGLPEDLSTCIHQQDCPDCSHELGQGESIGETEVLLGQTWLSSFMAVRDTEVVAMPKSLFDCLLSSAIDPSIAVNLSRIIASKINTERALNASNASEFPAIRASNVKTVAIVPISPSYHHLAAVFAHSLRDELCLMSNGLLLDSTIPLEVLGKEAFSAIGELRLTDWLNQCEQDYRLVLYLADAHPRTGWTSRCIRQADIIFFVAWADASEPHTLGTHEKLLVADQQSFVKCELVLIHPKRFCRSGSTRPWLEARPWISMHHHVHLGEKVQDEEENTDENDNVTLSRSVRIPLKRRQLVSMLMARMDNLGLMYPRDGLFSIFPVYDTFRPGHPGHSDYQSASKGQFNDCARIARRLLGRAVGLVLGGGGGRGISHMGILRQLVDAGVPIDAVGGTSIGAFVGGLFARDQDCDTVQGFLKAYSRTLANPIKAGFMDLTLPIAAYFTGHSMNRSVWKAFGGREIEDLWLPYFAVSVDVARTGLKVHRSGVVWRYVRASMSIAGLLPPLCDGDSLLVDGGYLNNVPADIMARSGDCGHIIAIDVGSTYPPEVYDYGDTLSGWWALLQRLFGKAPHILSYAEIQSRLAYAMCDSSILQLIDASKVNSRIQYLKPPVGNASVLSFDRFDEMLQIGIDYGQERISRWREDGTLNQLLGLGPQEDQDDSHRLGLVPLSALAEDKDSSESLLPALDTSLAQVQSHSSHEISFTDEMESQPKESDSVYSKVSSVETTPLLQANSSFNRRRRTRSL